MGEPVAIVEEAPAPGAAGARAQEVYRVHGARLVALGRLLTGDVSEGEDLTQDVMLRLLRSLERDAAAVHDPVWPWLRAVAARLACDRARRLRREAQRLVLLRREAPAGEWSGATLDVLDALRSLPRRTRAVAVLHLLEDQSPGDIARALGRSQSTVENQLRAARRLLRERLRENHDA